MPTLDSSSTATVLRKHQPWMPEADLARLAGILASQVPLKNSTLEQRRVVQIFSSWRLPVTFPLIIDLAGGSRTSAAQAMRESLLEAAAHAGIIEAPGGDCTTTTVGQVGKPPTPDPDASYIYRDLGTAVGGKAGGEIPLLTALRFHPSSGPDELDQPVGDNQGHGEPATAGDRDNPAVLALAERILERVDVVGRDLRALSSDMAWTKTMIDDARQLTRMRQTHGVLSEPSAPVHSKTALIAETTASLAGQYKTSVSRPIVSPDLFEAAGDAVDGRME